VALCDDGLPEVCVISEIDMLVRLVLAAGLGALIGLDRETRAKPAGVRTFAIVALGACIFTLVAEMAFTGEAETSRVVSTIITGVGFLGAGTIIHRQSDVLGLTTAAGIWASAGVGMAVGMGLFLLAVAGSILIVVFLWILARVAERVPREPDEKGAERSVRDGGGSSETPRYDRADDVASKG
jgi:putative Mg2+ transporter-C (MgtC) family protein